MGAAVACIAAAHTSRGRCKVLQQKEPAGSKTREAGTRSVLARSVFVIAHHWIGCEFESEGQPKGSLSNVTLNLNLNLNLLWSTCM